MKATYFEAEMKNDVLFLSQDQKLRKEVAKFKHKFMTKADALIHSDLHSGLFSLRKIEQSCSILNLLALARLV